MNRIITKTYSDHTESANSLNETLFHTANGYLGVRASLEEGVPDTWNTMRGTYINGFYDVIPMKQAENLCNFVDKKDTMVNVADTMTVNCNIDGERFDMLSGVLHEHTRILNMNEGYSLRKVVWTSPKGKKIEITSKRMTSYEMLSLFTIEYTVRPLEDSADIEIISSHIAGVSNYCDPNDPRLAAESIKNLSVIDLGHTDGISYEVSNTKTSNLQMCSLVKNVVCKVEGDDGSSVLNINGKSTVLNDRIDESFEAVVPAGGELRLTKYCIYTDSIRCADVKGEAMRLLETACSNKIEYYYDKQKSYMDEFWKRSSMEVYGDEAVNLAVSFNMYELLQSAAKDKFCSIAAKGMSGEGYEGHYFWDTEVFILPFFILTNPELAKMILTYRYQTLDKARENAGLLGHSKGALFPWRTITGCECSGYFVSGSAAYHINADIAYAIISYYLTTGDIEFIASVGEEILLETARLWLDLGNYNSDGKFVLNDVTGPDEYTCMINNNYYTNCAAKYNIAWAVKLYGELEKRGMAGDLTEKLGITRAELDKMDKAAECMLLLYDEKTGINPQDDSFLDKPVWDFENTPKENYPLLLHYHPLHLYRYQVCKQADTVLAHFMFEEMQTLDVMRKSYDYYEKITTHDSSLSTCVFSIVASRLGMHAKGYDYFGDSTKLDLENTHNNTKDGVHTANMGGCYMAIVNGFAGLRIREDGIYIAPFVPEDWNGYCFNVVYKQRLLEIKVTDDRVEVRLCEGEKLDIHIYGETYNLTSDSVITTELRTDSVAVIGA